MVDTELYLRKSQNWLQTSSTWHKRHSYSHCRSNPSCSVEIKCLMIINGLIQFKKKKLSRNNGAENEYNFIMKFAKEKKLLVCNGFDFLRWVVRTDASTLDWECKMTDLILFRCCFYLFNLFVCAHHTATVCHFNRWLLIFIYTLT